jgi:hypothetical protein
MENLMPTENCPSLGEVEVSDLADFLSTTDDHVRRAHAARDSKESTEEFETSIKDLPLLELRKLYLSNGLNTSQFYAVIREMGKSFPKGQQSVSAA